MAQPPPPYDNSGHAKTSVEIPADFPSYPGTQHLPPLQYPSPQGPTTQYTTTPHSVPNQYNASQYPAAQYTGTPFQPQPQQSYQAPGALLDHLPISNRPYIPNPNTPNSAFIPGQVEIPNREQQFCASGPYQQQPQYNQIPNQFGTQSGPSPSLPNEAPVPSAPSIDQMDKVPGYENVTFDGGYLPPPPPDPNARGQQPIRVDFTDYPTLTTEDAREALLTYVGGECCYGKRAARNMALNNIKNTSAIHYTLETFAERRETLWAFEPYIGQMIDSPANGPAPGPWEISIPKAEPYVNKTVLIEVPHTASVKPCHDCGSSGAKMCLKCLGAGRVRCHHCDGRGRRFASDDRCSWCWGRGQETCHDCNGGGRMVCPSCNGKVQLKWFIQMKSVWRVHLLDYIIERTPMPDDLVRTVTGKIVFEEDASRIWPITNFPDEELNTASATYVQKHNAIQETERVISQRHKIRIIPVAEVNSTWNGKQDDFYVYGFENKVHSPNYPQQCCWGCIIL